MTHTTRLLVGRFSVSGQSLPDRRDNEKREACEPVRAWSERRQKPIGPQDSRAFAHG
jgi:hypothetical protein